MNALMEKLPLWTQLRPVDRLPETRDLFQAVERNDEYGIISAVLAGEDINARSCFDLTPLHLACRAYGLAAARGITRPVKIEHTIKLLLAMGADAKLYDKTNSLPAAWCEGNMPPCLRARMAELARQKAFPALEPDDTYGDGERPPISSRRTWNFVPVGKVGAYKKQLSAEQT